ncbi:lysosomal membrane ascorbate-dependent ferrireductase CYB561A3 isoform X1 [Ixodes scapularis]
MRGTSRRSMCVDVANPPRVELDQVRVGPGSSWTKFELDQVRVVPSSSWTRFELDQVRVGPGSSWTRFELDQVRVGPGSSWTRFELDQVRVGPGSSWTRFESDQVKPQVVLFSDVVYAQNHLSAATTPFGHSRHEYRARKQQQQSNNNSSGQREAAGGGGGPESATASAAMKALFYLLLLLAEVLLFGTITLTIYWIFNYQGGVAWANDTRKQFNLHYILMVGGFIFLNGHGATGDTRGGGKLGLPNDPRCIRQSPLRAEECRPSSFHQSTESSASRTRPSPQRCHDELPQQDGGSWPPGVAEEEAPINGTVNCRQDSVLPRHGFGIESATGSEGSSVSSGRLNEAIGYACQW